jgi:hypothetical protein
MTPNNGLAALHALRSERGRYKLREICTFLNQRLKIPASVSYLSKIENFKTYKKPCPALISIGLVAMYNARVAGPAEQVLLPTGKIAICCDKVMDQPECKTCKGKHEKLVVNMDKLTKAANK